MASGALRYCVDKAFPVRSDIKCFFIQSPLFDFISVCTKQYSHEQFPSTIETVS